MFNTHLYILIAVFFLTSVLSVVTGSTSLITVPAMISLGMEAHVAVATNMLALTFMSIGVPCHLFAAVPFTAPTCCRALRLRLPVRH